MNFFWKKQKIKLMNKDIKERYFIYLIFSLLYVSLLLGLFLNEDNLGGAAHDSMYHFKISEKFSENFSKLLMSLVI